MPKESESEEIAREAARKFIRGLNTGEYDSFDAHKLSEIILSALLQHQARGEKEESASAGNTGVPQPDVAPEELIQAARNDTERLDWLESHRTQVGSDDNALMALPFWYQAKGRTLREAIDSARAQGSATHAVQAPTGQKL